MVATAGDSLKGASVYGRSLDGKRSELELALDPAWLPLAVDTN